MVLPPPDAAEGQAAQAEWLRVLRRWLHLGHKGVIVAIRRAQPERLRELVEALEVIEPGFGFVGRAQDVLACEPGTLLLLGLRAEGLDWLNLNRPLFAERKLRVVLWAEGELAVELKFRAPDLHDWVSHFVDCPPGVAAHAVEGLKIGLQWWPGVAWTGGDFDAAWAELDRGDAPPRRDVDMDYGGLVDLLAASEPDVPVRAWTGVDTHHKLTRLRWAIAESGYEGRHVLIEPTVSTPGWFPVDATCMSLTEAAALLREAGVEDPCRAAARLGLEADAVELFASWGHDVPEAPEQVVEAVRRRASADDVLRAAVLARSGLLMRALHGDERVLQVRDGLAAARKDDADRHRIATSLSLFRKTADWKSDSTAWTEFDAERRVHAAVRANDGDSDWMGASLDAHFAGHSDIGRRWWSKVGFLSRALAFLSPTIGDARKAVESYTTKESLGDLARALLTEPYELDELDELGMGEFSELLVGLAKRRGWHHRETLRFAIGCLAQHVHHKQLPDRFLEVVLTSAAKQLGSTDPDYLRLLRALGTYAIIRWPDVGADLLLEEYEKAGGRIGPPTVAEKRLLAWAHALLARGQFGEAVDLLRPHAGEHPSVARLLARALLRRGDREAAERLVATHELPALAQIESTPLEHERRAFFEGIVDAFMSDAAAEDA